MRNRRSSDAPFYIIVTIWILSAMASLAWLGTLIWAIIYVVTHLGEWLN